MSLKNVSPPHEKIFFTQKFFSLCANQHVFCVHVIISSSSIITRAFPSLTPPFCFQSKILAKARSFEKAAWTSFLNDLTSAPVNALHLCLELGEQAEVLRSKVNKHLTNKGKSTISFPGDLHTVFNRKGSRIIAPRDRIG